MKRPNVEVIAGNHCVMACECFSFLLQEITEDTVEKMNVEMIGKLLEWQRNGATSTIEEFHKCDKNTQREIVDFISDFEVYDEIEVAGNTLINILMINM